MLKCIFGQKYCSFIILLQKLLEFLASLTEKFETFFPVECTEYDFKYKILARDLPQTVLRLSYVS